MKLFECTDGTLINPMLVSSCYATDSRYGYFAIFEHSGEEPTKMQFLNLSEAWDEVKAFSQHFEENTP